MPESGGTTTQSGIFYQNSIAALYLGRLCDLRPRPASERVIEVRVEAPAPVDDTVVTYADRHREWIQAKENLARNSDAWRKVWGDFEKLRWQGDFGSEDRIVLMLGAYDPAHQVLKELCARAGGAENPIEWRAGFNQGMPPLVENIKTALSAHHNDDHSLLALLSHLDIRFLTLEQIERDEVVRWIPPSNCEPVTMFGLLRDMLGGHARYRVMFRAPQLLGRLAANHNVRVEEPAASGLPAYRLALEGTYGQIEVPGTGFAGDIDSLFLWPYLHIASADLVQLAPVLATLLVRGQSLALSRSECQDLGAEGGSSQHRAGQSLPPGEDPLTRKWVWTMLR